MIQKYGKMFVAICDICGAELEAQETYYYAVEEQKDKGWETRKNGSEWETLCTECQETEGEKK